jgi:hypothetical protein
MWIAAGGVPVARSPAGKPASAGARLRPTTRRRSAPDRACPSGSDRSCGCGCWKTEETGWPSGSWENSLLRVAALEGKGTGGWPMLRCFPPLPDLAEEEAVRGHGFGEKWQSEVPGKTEGRIGAIFLTCDTSPGRHAARALESVRHDHGEVKEWWLFTPRRLGYSGAAATSCGSAEVWRWPAS